MKLNSQINFLFLNTTIEYEYSADANIIMHSTQAVKTNLSIGINIWNKQNKKS